MKKIELSILIALISCSIFSQNHKYADNITFKIDKVKELSSIAVGNQSWIYPSRGNKFVVINISIQNKADKTQNIDLDNFILLNFKDKTKHKLEMVQTTGIVNFPAKIDLKINPKKKKKRRLIYIYPENVTPKSIMLFDEIINIYAKYLK